MRTRRRGEMVEIQVADDGPGIPADVKAKIFDWFFTTKPPGEGTGLRLAVSREILQAHGGNLRLEDTPGGGASVRPGHSAGASRNLAGSPAWRPPATPADARARVQCAQCACLWTLLGAGQLPEASRSKLRIVGLLYFIEGSPVSVLWEVLPVYLRLHGTSLRAIGGLRLLELPFSLKFLWSPLVQRFGDRRTWVTGAMRRGGGGGRPALPARSGAAA